MDPPYRVVGSYFMLIRRSARLGTPVYVRARMFKKLKTG